MKHRMNPVLRKDLRVSVRTYKFALLVTIYNLVLAMVALYMFFMYFDSRYHMELEYQNIVQIYIAIAIIEYALTIFIVPVQTASSIAGERERQTLEILLTTTLKPRQIIMGKLQSSLANVLLLVVSSLPIVSIVFSIGGVTIWAVAGMLIMIFSSAIYAGSIGIWASARTKKTIPAIVTTFCIMFVIGIGTILLPVAVYWIQYEMDLGYADYEGIGHAAWLLLINPALSIFSLFTEEFGASGAIQDFVVNELGGELPNFILAHWFSISLLIQFAISALFMFMAAKLLDPLRKRRMKRKERKEWKQLQKELAGNIGGEV